MNHWARRSSEIARRDRVVQGIVGVTVALAALLPVLGVPQALLIGTDGVGALAATVAFCFRLFQFRVEEREAWEEVLLQPPVLVRDVAVDERFFDIGVETEAHEALELAGQGHRRHAVYLKRDVDKLVRAKLIEAASGGAPSLVVISGPAKGGKSRTLAEAVSVTLSRHWLLAPKDAGSLVRLARAGSPRPLGHGPFVIWLDDIEPFVRIGNQGLSPQTLAMFASWDRPVVLVGTAGGKGVTGAYIPDGVSDLLRRNVPVPMTSSLTAAEKQWLMASDEYSGRAKERIAVDGPGEFMIVAPKLVERLARRNESPEGVAVARAAIDWRRAGFLKPVPVGLLRELSNHYLSGPRTSARFNSGLAWATAPIYAEVALIQETPGGYSPYDFIVQHADNVRLWEIPEPAWELLLHHAEAHELVELGQAAWARGETQRAESAYLCGEAAGVAEGPYYLGMLCHERGDLQAAETAWRRADRMGSAEAAYLLGAWLAEEGGASQDVEEAFRRAADRGQAQAATRLGTILRLRGDIDGAEEAYRRGMERGDPDGALGLGGIHYDRGELGDAEAVYRWADARGNGLAAANLGVILQERHDLANAEAAFRRAADRGEPRGAGALARLLEQRGDLAGAETAYKRAAASGDVDCQLAYARFCQRHEDLNSALEFFCRAEDAGGAVEAAISIGDILRERRDSDGAEAAYRRAESRGSAIASHKLGELLSERQRKVEATEAYSKADQAGIGEAAHNLALQLEEDGQIDAAKQAYRRALSRGIEESAGNLAHLLLSEGHIDEAACLARRVARSLPSPGSSFLLGLVFERQGDVDEACEAYSGAPKSDDDVADYGAISICMCQLRANNFDRAREALLRSLPDSFVSSRAAAVQQIGSQNHETRLRSLQSRIDIRALLEDRMSLLDDDGSEVLEFGEILQAAHDYRAARRAYEIARASPVPRVAMAAIGRMYGLPPDIFVVRMFERVARRRSGRPRTLDAGSGDGAT